MPAGIEELRRLFEMAAKHPKRMKKMPDPVFEPLGGNRWAFVGDVPRYLEWLLPDFHIPIRAGMRAAFEEVNKLVVRHISAGQTPPAKVLELMHGCIDTTVESTPTMREKMLVIQNKMTPAPQQLEKRG